MVLKIWNCVFLLKFWGKKLKLELFPWIRMENFRIRIWIRMENFRIQDPDPYNNSYRSVSIAPSPRIRIQMGIIIGADPKHSVDALVVSNTLVVVTLDSRYSMPYRTYNGRDYNQGSVCSWAGTRGRFRGGQVNFFYLNLWVFIIIFFSRLWNELSSLIQGSAECLRLRENVFIIILDSRKPFFIFWSAGSF